MSLASNLAITNNSTQTLTLSGNIDTNGHSITFAGSGNITVNGVISGSGSVIQSGSGVLTPGAINSYTGTTTISSGTLSIANGGALGAPPASVTPNSITLNGGTLLFTAPYAANGSNPSLNANRGITLGPAGGTISIPFTNTPPTGGNNLGSENAFIYSGVISGTGNLTLVGVGGAGSANQSIFDLGAVETYGGTTTVNNAAATVTANPSIIAVSVGSISATTGQSFSGAVATFTDTNPHTTAGQYSATITWGDGSTSAGTIAAGSAGGFTVSGSHTYSAASPVGGDALSVSVARDAQHSGNGSGAAIVTAPMNAAPTVATAASATPASASTAALSVLGADDGGETNLTYTWATVGTPPATVTFSSNGANSSKNTTATFTAPGTYLLQVAISDGTLSTTSSVSVTADPSVISLNGSGFTVTAGQAYSGQVAHFTDTNPSTTTASYSALITWGDGNTSAGSIVTDPSGGFDVNGGNTYSTAGSYNFTVTVTRDAFHTATSDGTATINALNAPALTANAVSSSEIDLTWAAPTDGSHLELEEKGPSDTNFMVISIPSPTTTGGSTYAITGLTANAIYDFRLRADLNGLESYSAAPAATQPAPGAPGSPGSPSIATPTNTQLSIVSGGVDTWSFNGPYGQASDPTQWDWDYAPFIRIVSQDPFHLQLGSGNADDIPTFNSETGQWTDQFQNGQLVLPSPYNYLATTVVATGEQNSSPSTPIPISNNATLQLDPPTLTSTPLSNGQVQIGWSWPEGTQAAESTYLTFYEVSGGSPSEINFHDAAAGSGSITINAGPAGSKVFAWGTVVTGSYEDDKTSESKYSNFVSADGSSNVPATPQNLSATPTNAHGLGPINVLWDNTSDNENNFTVERYTALNSDGTPHSPVTITNGGQPQADTPAVVDKGDVGQDYFLEGQTYNYIVQANGDERNSAFSSPVSVTFPEFCMTCSGGQLSAGGDQSNASGPSLAAQTGDWTAGATVATTGSTTGTSGNPLFIAQLNGNNEVTAVYGPGEQAFFTLNSDGSYTEKFGGTDTLTHTGGQFILTDAGGNPSFFSDSFAMTSQGFESHWGSSRDAAGNGAQVISRNSAGNITEVHIVNAAGIQTEDWLYTYVASGANAGQLQSVTQKIKNGSSFTASRILNYTYYDGTNSDGSAGDIRTAAITDGSGNPIQSEYYRYYVAGDPNGAVHQLKYKLTDGSLRRVQAANSGTALDALTDAQLAPYADIALQYNSAGQVVTRTLQGEGCSACSGGQGTYTESYSVSGNAAGVNNWQNKTVETQPDGNQNISYFNSNGQLMLSVYKDTTTGQMWGTFTEYDSAGRAIRNANPSAVLLPTSLATIEAYPDLLHSVSGNYQYLSDTTGLITLTDYADSTSATETTAGTAANYEEDTKIQQGETGTPILQESMSYFAHSDSDGNMIFPTATDTTYANTDGTGARTTSHAYTWMTGSLQMASDTTTLPVISSSQNGPGVADSSTDVYNALGQLVWSKDGGGFLTYNAYDTATGALVKTIQDVNTSNTSDYDATYLPSGWTTPTGGGLNLTTTYVVDNLGRTTKTTDPNGDVTYTVYNDAFDASTGFENEVRTYPGWHQDTTSGLWTTTGPVSVSRTNVTASYSESLTYAYAPASGVTTPTGTDAISSSNIQSLSRQLTSAGGQITESDAYVNLSGVTYSAGSFHLGSAGTNYNATTYGYDEIGNQDRVQDPNGTITRTVYDGQRRILSTWIGTNDTPTTGYWSPTNNAGANMVMVSSNVYDNGGVGDSNLTETIQYPGSGQANRATLNFDDWRDRPIASKQGAAIDSSGTPTPSSETDGVHRPITFTVLDNLGEAIEQDQYDGDGVAITSTAGVPNAPSSSLLRAKSATGYDDQGRAFQTKQYSVDPTTGAVSTNALTSEAFYDHRGDEIASSSPTGLWSKSVIDGAGRNVESYMTDGGVLAGATINWTNANSVADDVVLSQTDTTFDADGNAILTTDRERLPGDPQTGSRSTGALGNASGTGGPAANVYFMAMYYDNASRETDSVNVGTNGGSAYTRPGSPAARSDTALVNSTAYGDNGMPAVTTDPRGIRALTKYDLLGQTAETIAAWDGTSGATPTSSTNQTTLFTHDGIGDQTSMTAVMPTGTPSQTTDWIYGVAGGTSNIFSNDMLAKVEYPDATTGAASSAAADDVTYTHDALGEATSMTDQNGSTHAYSRDGLGRETLDAVTTLGSGVDGSVRAISTTFNTQGLPFQETSYSDAAATTVVNQNQDVYNGLGQLAGEYQAHSGAVNILTTPEVQYAFSDPSLGSRQTSMTYPNGRVLDDVYNIGIDTTIGRVSSIADAGGSAAGNLQGYTYQGLATIVGNADGDGVTETTTLDNFGRTGEMKYVNLSTGLSTDDFAYGYDRDGDVLFKNNLLNSAESELYHANSASAGDNNTAYDPLTRLNAFERGALSSSGNNGTSLDTVATATDSQSWNLNAVGDQSSVTTNGATTTNSTNAKNELTANGAHSLTFDNNGNTLTDENGQATTYDAWNHSITVKNSGGTTIASYSYDPQGWRIAETAAGMTTDVYFTNQWQAIEERQGGTVTRQNVWGLGFVNQLVERDDSSTSGILGISSSGLGRRLYGQQDFNGSVTSLVDGSGSVAQRMTYLPYGSVTFLTASWASGSDAYTQNVLFQGGRLEIVTGNYVFDHRDYDSAIGIWMQSDPAQYLDGANTFSFERNRPANSSDPFGLMTLGAKIDWWLTGRFSRGVTNWALHTWNATSFNDDEGEMNKLVPIEMNRYYRYIIENSGMILGSDWKTISVSWQSAKAAVGQFDAGSGPVLSTPWFLGGSNDVKASGRLQARCVNGNVYIRDISFQWLWFDRIHARSYIQGWMDVHNNPLEWFVEGTADIFLDKIWDADFPVTISWTDIRALSENGQPLYAQQ